MNTVFTTDDGSHSLMSNQFGVTYHSTHGAIQETQVIFIEAGLKAKLAQNLLVINILEIGFGTGLNALKTWIEAEKAKFPINYTTFEKYPISLAEAENLNYADQLGVPQTAFLSLHSCNFDQKHPLSINDSKSYFSFQKVLADFHEIDFDARFDLIYFDAFSPESQPELWEVPLLKKMYKALKLGGILTTYCAKGQFKRNLKSVGFKVEGLAGPVGKREITRARKE